MKDFFTHQDLFTCQNTADFHSAVEGSSINGIRLVPFDILVSSISWMKITLLKPLCTEEWCLTVLDKAESAHQALPPPPLLERCPRTQPC